MLPATLEEWSQWPLFVVVTGGASFISLLITVGIAWKLRGINARIILHARQRPWLKSLRDSRSALAPFLRDTAESGDEIREILFKTKPTLRELGRSIPLLSQWRLEILVLQGMISRHLSERTVIRLLGFAAPKNRLPRAIHEKLLEVTQTLYEQIERSKAYRE